MEPEECNCAWEEDCGPEEQLDIPARTDICVSRWKPPPDPVFKLNFDVAIFSELNVSGVGVIIRNCKGEVMAAMTAKGPPVGGSEEAEILACRRALEFAIDAGFTDLIVEGDNAAVMSLLSSSGADLSRLGHIILDIQCLANGIRWVCFSHVKRGANSVAHVLARHAKNVTEEIVWLKDTPPPASEALYYDSLYLNE
ncbi:uncharacterized protein LOC126690344 [Quercus robur]|uniref:uncharacterized protein LOC126690344 n=1 Tax=Quercus robur TaxID=38942 RepID=UPI0021631A49|nr:uncharacterized protein LOC126690344 [Quercus robur]